MTVSATTRRFAPIAALALFLSASAALAIDPIETVLEEHVTGGELDLYWAAGFGLSNRMQPETLAPEHPAYANPSGDHTVAVATTSAAPDSGGIILTAIDPTGIDDYLWEGWVFTGTANSRRGLVVRADPSNGFASHYQFVIQQGGLQFAFRKLVNSTPTTLRTWLATDFPGGPPAANTWHRMKVMAEGSQFRCWWDDFEVTSIGGPIEDTAFSSGWAGVYNFRFDVGQIPFYTDDLVLTDVRKTPALHTTLGGVKRRWSGSN